jgi:uncharacterized protein YndB with AHSA1/START domain
MSGMEMDLETRTVVVERRFAHAPEKVWRALTESRLIAQWLMENDFEPEVERKFRFRAQPSPPHWDGVIECEVRVIEPQKRLAYSWCTLGLESEVVFTLAAAEGGTTLRMEHSGFRADQQAAYKGATYGWQRFLGQLEQMLDREEA